MQVLKKKLYTSIFLFISIYHPKYYSLLFVLLLLLNNYLVIIINNY